MKRYGSVLWFDKSSGEGMVFDLATGKNLYVHYSAIICEDKFKTIQKYDYVEFSIYRNLYSMQIDKCVVLENDFDYKKINLCLEMSFRRGIDILSHEPKYK